MPSSVIAAVVGSAVAETVAGYAIFTLEMGALGTSLLSAAAGGLASVAVGAAFSDTPDQSQSQQQFTQELRDNLVTVRQPISHWQYIYGRTRVGGALTFAHESADDNFHLIITVAGHVSQEIETIQFGAEVVPLDGNGDATGRYAGYVRIKKSLGDEAGQPFPDLVAESEGKWTDAHRQSGRTKIYVRLTWSADLFPTGLPNITVVAKGRKVYDPRTGLTVWSDTASLCVVDYLCDTAASLGSVYADEIDNTQLIAAANIDDEAVNLAAGGTEKRYTLNGAFLVNAEPRAVLGRLLTANAGKARYIGGVWRIEPAAYAVPTITLSEDDLRAVPHISPRLSGGDLSNRVKGLYVSEANLWQPTDFPPVTNATYLAEDEGEPSWHELDLPYTKSVATAQRIAKTELEKMRQQISVDWPGKFSCYRLQPGDTVKINFSMLGWVEKVFEVAQAKLVFEGDDDGMRLGCDLSLRETASTVFDWGTGEETTVDSAPDTNLPDPWSVTAPGTPTVTESKYETTGSVGVRARATMTWASVGDGFVVDYLTEYRVAGGTWIVRPATLATTDDIDDIAPGTYEFRVRARNALGVHSPYSGTRSKEIVGLTDAPATVTGFSVVAFAGAATGRWALTPDLDVKIGGRIFVRWTPLTTGAAWENGIDVRDFNGDATSGPLPMLTGTYFAKARDSTGHWSAAAASFVLTAGNLTALPDSMTVTEHTAFAGAKSGVAAVDGVLKLEGTSLIDSLTDLIDDWGYIDNLGGVGTAGTYDFSAAMDFGSVVTRRITPTIQALAYDTGDMVDFRGPVDDWDSVDGDVINDATAQLQAAISADGVSYGSWFPLLSGDLTCRAVKFRLALASAAPTHNIQISQLSVTANW